MERGLKSKKGEARTLFKKCFQSTLFSFVPYEIWRDFIVSNADLKAIVFTSQTCWAFQDLVNYIGENNFNLALMLRKESQIPLAKKFLFRCAENNNSTAMFHLGYALRFGGWGLNQDKAKSAEWFKKSAELGNTHAMAYYSECLLVGSRVGVMRNIELGRDWAKKALSSNDSYAIGYCYRLGLGCNQDLKGSFALYQTPAESGDEFAQYMMGYCLYYGHGTEKDFVKSFYWYLKSAEQGFCFSQHNLAHMLKHGEGCEQSDELYHFWKKKVDLQRNLNLKL